MNNFINYESAMMSNFNGLQPIDIKGITNPNNYYQCRYLWNKIYSKFEFDFDGLEWDLNTFRLLLFKFGSLATFNTEMGWIFAPWNVAKLNIYLNPKKITGVKLLSSDYFKNLQGTVGEDCSIIRIMDDYRGINDLVEATAELLANCDKAINVALMNANVNLVAYCENKKEAEEIRHAYSLATTGQPLVVIGKDKILDTKNNLMEPFTNHDTVGQMDKLLVCRRTIVNNFLTEIGIKNANTMKKERLISDEVNENNEEISANIGIWYENIKNGLDVFNRISGHNVTVTLKETDVDDDTLLLGGGDDV